MIFLRMFQIIDFKSNRFVGKENRTQIAISTYTYIYNILYICYVLTVCILIYNSQGNGRTPLILITVAATATIRPFSNRHVCSRVPDDPLLGNNTLPQNTSSLFRVHKNTQTIIRYFYTKFSRCLREPDGVFFCYKNVFIRFFAGRSTFICHEVILRRVRPKSFVYNSSVRYVQQKKI